MVENILPIQHTTNSKETEKVTEEEPLRVPKLYLMYDLSNKDLSAKILSILSEYPGNSDVIVKNMADKKAYSLGIKVNPKGFLVNELHAYIEDDYIKVL